MQKVSVILPCKESANTIRGCLDSIAGLNYPKQFFELIVVDGNSEDSTEEIVEKFATDNPDLKLKILKEEGISGAGYAINLGLKVAENEIIAFTNADCEVGKDWLERLVEPFKDDGVAGVAGIVVTPENVNLLQRLVGYELEYRYSTLKDYVVSAPEMNLAYRKDILEKLGGFDWRDFKTAYDVDMAYRVNKAGYKIIFCPRAMVKHYHRGTLKEYWDQQVVAAENRVSVIRKHRDGVKGDNFANKFLMAQPILVSIITIYLSFLVYFRLLITPIYALLAIYLGLNLIYTLFIFARFPFLRTLLVFPLNIFRGIALTVGMIKGALKLFNERTGLRSYVVRKIHQFGKRKLAESQ